GPGALDPHPPHVRDVEQTCRPADGEVLIADRAVLLGHLPTAEVDHAPTERDVSVVEWRALQGAIRRQPFRRSRWRRDRCRPAAPRRGGPPPRPRPKPLTEG